MKVFPSKSSALVKLITFGFIVVAVLIGLSLVMTFEGQGVYYGTGLIIILFAISFYFYSQSVVNITLSDDALIINKNIGCISLQYHSIREVEKLGFNNLGMTGSKGVFGFIGIPMDNAYSYVKDRKKMIKIHTEKKNYLLSCESRDELIAALKKKIS